MRTPLYRLKATNGVGATKEDAQSLLGDVYLNGNLAGGARMCLPLTVSREGVDKIWGAKQKNLALSRVDRKDQGALATGLSGVKLRVRVLYMLSGKHTRRTKRLTGY